MESPKITASEGLKQQGRVIAQAVHDANVLKEKNMAKSAKRKESMLRNAADAVFK